MPQQQHIAFTVESMILSATMTTTRETAEQNGGEKMQENNITRGRRRRCLFFSASRICYKQQTQASVAVEQSEKLTRIRQVN